MRAALLAIVLVLIVLGIHQYYTWYYTRTHIKSLQWSSTIFLLEFLLAVVLDWKMVLDFEREYKLLYLIKKYLDK